MIVLSHCLWIIILNLNGLVSISSKLKQLYSKLSDRLVNQCSITGILDTGYWYNDALAQYQIGKIAKNSAEIQHQRGVPVRVYYGYGNNQWPVCSPVVSTQNCSEGDYFVKTLDLSDGFAFDNIDGICVKAVNGQYYSDSPIYIQHATGNLFLQQEPNKKLQMRPLTKPLDALFTRRVFVGYKFPTKREKSTIPDYDRVTVNMFRKDGLGNEYITNTSVKSVTLASMETCPNVKLLDERNSQYFYYRPLVGTQYCVFMSTHFEKYYLSYDDESNEVDLIKVESFNLFLDTNKYNNAKFILRSPSSLEIVTTL